MESQLGLGEESFDLRYSVWAREVLNELPDCFTITDPCVPGHPIVFASNGFLKMVGYSREEVVGRNGRMFQGPETDRRSVMAIHEAIREERGVQISLLNYRKDGTPFWMLFQMCPVFSKEDDRVINFVGVQVPLSRRPRLSGLRLGSECEDESGVRDTENFFLFLECVFAFKIMLDSSSSSSIHFFLDNFSLVDLLVSERAGSILCRNPDRRPLQ